MALLKQPRPALLCIHDWIVDNYSINPRYIAEQNATKEARTAKAVMELAKENNAQLIRCRVTGQAVGQLFDFACDTVIPATIAPTWVVMPKDTEERLARAPLATTVYLITRCLTGETLSHYLETKNFSEVQKIDEEVNWLASVYDALVENPQHAPLLFVAINDLVKRFGINNQTQLAIFHLATALVNAEPIETVLRPVAHVWKEQVLEITSARIADSSTIAEIDHLIQTTLKMRARPAEVHTSLSNLLVRATPTRKSNNKRADVAVHREVNQELSEGIAALFANMEKQMQEKKTGTEK